MQKKDAAKAPSTPGVYIFYNQELPIYIGKATNIKARILSHFNNAKLDAKERLIIDEATRIEYLKTDSDFRAILLEAKLINKYKPRHNVRGRDDKNNLYIQINIHDRFPKVLSTRRTDLEKNSIFFGPFSSQKVVLEVINYLRKIVPFCTQKKISKHACFYSKISLCSPCPNYILSIKDFTEQKRLEKIYRDNIKQVVRILQGKTKTVLLNLHKKLNQTIKNQEYEQGIKIRNQIYRFEYLIHEKTFRYDQPFVLHNTKETLASLQILLKKYLPNVARLTRIEGVDISNLQDKEIVGSLVTFIEGIPSKADYKRFKIKKPTRSDFERIEEVIERRFKNDWPRPDLLIVDGGQPQVKTVARVLTEMKIDLPLIGIAKDPDRLVIGSQFLIVRLPLDHPGFNLVKAVRDEAHRFAKKYHLLLRSKKFKI